MNLLQLLLGVMTSQSSVGSVSGKTGLSDKQIKQLMMLAIPLLLKYMTKNASSQDGALSLLGALSQHTSKKEMNSQMDDADEADGEKIIGHILGKNEGKVTQDLSAKTGLDSSQIHKVLSIIAPALMSGVSEAASSSTASQTPSAAPSLAGLAASGIFGSLFGLGKAKKKDKKEAADDDNDAELNGTALLQALLQAGK